VNRPLSPAPDIELDQAYRATVYRVLYGEPFDLRIDRYSQALADWQLHMSVSHSDLITAFNPGSRVCSGAENVHRSRQLERRLPSNLRVAAVGIDPSGVWPDEAGFLIGGMDRDQVLELMVEFGQNAWVHAGPEAIPRLEWVTRR